MNYIIQTTEPDELIQELVPYLPAIKNLSIEHDSLNELFLEVTGEHTMWYQSKFNFKRIILRNPNFYF